MQTFNKNKSIKIKLSVASAALCASFLLATNSNEQSVKADTVNDQQEQANSNKTNTTQDNQSIQNNAIQYPDIPVQVVGSEKADQTSETANQVTSSVNTSNPTSTTTNASVTVPTIVKVAASNKVVKAKTGLQSKTVNARDNSWDNVQTDYDDANHVLTIKGGSIANPNPIYKQFADKASDLQTIKITDKVTLSGSAKGLFSNLTNLKTIEGLENIDVTDVTDMSYMFDSDASLAKLDLMNWVPENTTDMNHMFSNCTNLAVVSAKAYYDTNATNWFNTKKVTNMSAMFQWDKHLNYFGDPSKLNSFDPDNDEHRFELTMFTDNVTDMSYMFQGCDTIVGFNFENNTPNVKTMSHMLSDCANLQSAYGSGMGTDNVSDFSYMLANNPKLEVAGFQGMSSLPENPHDITTSHMFYNDPLLTSMYFGNFYYITDASYMFAGDVSLNEPLAQLVEYILNPLDEKGNKVSKITNMSHMLEGCSGVTYLDLTELLTNDNVQPNKTDMFKGLTGLKKVTLGKDVNLEGTGFNSPFAYTAVGTGTEDKPNGKTYTATKLRKFWNNQTSTETFVGTPVKYYNVTVNFIDTKTQKVLKTVTKYGNSEDPLDFKNDFNQAIKELTQGGNYTYDSKNNTVPLDKNGDIQLPNDIKSDVTYTVGLTPKEEPVNPAPTPDPTPSVPVDTIITNVTVHYQDEFGNKLQADKTITGKLGGSWNAVSADIKGYHLVDTKGMATGTISDAHQEVTFVYAKDQPTKPVAPNKPNQKPVKPTKKPIKNKNRNKHRKPAVVINHGAILKPVNKAKVNKVASSSNNPTIVKSAYADTNNSNKHNNTSYDSKLPQTGTDTKNNGNLVLLGLGSILTAMLSLFGISKKKKF